MLLFEHLSTWRTRDSSHAFISIIIDGMFERRREKIRVDQYIFKKKKKPPGDTSISPMPF